MAKKSCPTCDKTVESLSNFCKHCGTELAALEKRLEKNCPECKAIIDPLAKFCRFCGKEFHKLAQLGPVGLVITIAILTAVVLLGAFTIYGFTTKVPYTVSVPYTSIETYDVIVPIMDEVCDSESLVNERITFRAQANYLKYQGFGSSVEKVFPTKVNNCKITGTWKTDNWVSSGQYCHGASGSFEGYADQFTQTVTSDANAFDWRGIGESYNPVPETFSGFAIYNYLCDNRGYENKRNFVRSKIDGIGTNMIKFEWEYFDGNTRPAVDYFVDLTCEVGKTKCVQVKQDGLVQKQREVTKYREETRYRLLISDWFSR
ncbi:MAG: zinc ribbon domain-containing protein [Candidatus Nanoarchaeia archaeon]|nr:zinc ribbon domain-containing protein [Candidatus Nanoarchaeia archaeon]